MNKNPVSTGKRIGLFLLLTFAITFAFEIIVLPKLIMMPQLGSVATLIVGSVMLIPAICVVLTRLITKEGFRDAWILPNFKGHIRYYLMGWLLPIVLIVLGAVFYFAVIPGSFDPSMGYLKQISAAQGVAFEPEQSEILGGIVLALLLAPVLNIITATGEEWGWRGYLLPKLMEKLTIIPTLLVSGVIWGLWHAPLIAILGHNYGFGYAGYPATGILAMCAFCIALGTLFSYIALKTRSCLPASIAHGTLNGFAAIGFYLTPGIQAIDPFLGPAPTGIIGGAGFVIVTVVLAMVMVRDQRRGTLIAPLRVQKNTAGIAA